MKRIEELEKEEEYKHNLLCRFVLDGLGKTVGESVAVDDDILIIKSKNRYLGIPLKHIEHKLFGLSLTIAGTQQHIEEPRVIYRNAYYAGAGLYKRLDLSKYIALVPEIRYAISNRSFLMDNKPGNNHYHTFSFSLPVLFYIKYLRRAFINPSYSWDGDNSSISVALCYLFIY